MSLLDKLKKNTTLKNVETLDKSVFFKDIEEVSTDVPALNIALSGDVDGGLRSGMLMISGDSKHFKCLRGDTVIEVYVKES